MDVRLNWAPLVSRGLKVGQEVEGRLLESSTYPNRHSPFSRSGSLWERPISWCTGGHALSIYGADGLLDRQIPKSLTYLAPVMYGSAIPPQYYRQDATINSNGS